MASLYVHRKIGELVNTLVTTRGSFENGSEMRRLRQFLQKSNKNVETAFSSIMMQLSKEHSEIRYRCAKLAHYLFLRSGRFRELMVEQLDDYLEFTLPQSSDTKLPPPKQLADLLRITVYLYVMIWDKKYAETMPRVGVVASILRRRKKEILPELVEVEEKDEIERESQRHQKRKFAQSTREALNSYKSEIERNFVEFDAAVALLVPDLPHDIASDVPETKTTTKTATNDFLDTKNDGFVVDVPINGGEPLVERTDENEDLFRTLLEYYKLAELHKKYLMSWKDILPENEFVLASLLKISRIERMVDDLRLLRPKKGSQEVEEGDTDNEFDSDDDDDLFMEVAEKEGYELYVNTDTEIDSKSRFVEGVNIRELIEAVNAGDAEREQRILLDAMKRNDEINVIKLKDVKRKRQSVFSKFEKKGKSTEMSLEEQDVRKRRYIE